MFNSTFKVELSGENAQAVILRIGPQNRVPLLRFENDLMTGEVYAYELCRKNDVDCPEILAFDQSRRFGDFFFLIEKCIAGRPLSELEADDKKAFHKQAGEQVKRIHTVQNNTFGRVSELVKGKGFTSWKAFLYDELDDVLTRSLTNDVFDKSEVKELKQVYRQCDALLSEITSPFLVHADLWDGNLLVDKATRKLTIIDMDRAVFGDVDFEFASPWIIDEMFCAGYGIDKTDFDKDNRKLRRMLYRLHFAVLDTYIWKIEFNDEAMFQKCKNGCKKVLEELKTAKQ
jgi:aminoglycoside phosphotransferase (APT) family kinase protein